MLSHNYLMTSGEGSRHWPRLSFEDQIWHGDPTWSGPAAPVSYRSAVPPEIAALTPVPSAEVASMARQAAAELVRFDGELGSQVEGFAPVLLRSEAASSSQIENLTASARAIFSAELGARTGENAMLIAANTRAMTAAIELSEALGVDAVARMHEVLLAEQPRHTPGRWRDEPVWIGTRSDSPVGAEFVAPDHRLVPGLLADLLHFAAREDIEPLVSVAITHAQFETIHPFTDGNGRTGRALAQAMLRRRGVTRNVAVPVSAGLLADVDGYHRALTAYREGDLDPIVVAFAKAAQRAISNSRILVTEVGDIRQSWENRLHVRRDSGAWRLLDILMRRPVLDAATAARELGVALPNVYPPLRALTEAGIVSSKTEHRMGPFWRSDEILSALDEFAKRAGRRSVT